MSLGPNEFDLSAAWVRRAQTDSKAFMEAFAVRLEGALPAQVDVDRKREGLFSKTTHVAKVAISLDNNVYLLMLERGHLVAQRVKSVHGVTLKSETLNMPDWLKSLQHDMAAYADHMGSAQQVLHDFLMS